MMFEFWKYNRSVFRRKIETTYIRVKSRKYQIELPQQGRCDSLISSAIKTQNKSSILVLCGDCDIRYIDCTPLFLGIWIVVGRQRHRLGGCERDGSRRISVVRIMTIHDLFRATFIRCHIVPLLTSGGGR